MQVGDLIESAIWVTGEESEKMLRDHEKHITSVIDDMCAQEDCIRGPLTFHKLKPGEERTPEVPDHIQGQKVRLLVAVATVVGSVVPTSQGSFIGNLDRNDLVLLRFLTRKNAPHSLTDEECDDVIEECGVVAALETIKYAVDGGIIH